MSTIMMRRRRAAIGSLKRTPPSLSILRDTARHGRKAALHQLSIYGCQMYTGVIAAAGDPLKLRFNDGAPVAATVVWCAGGMIGCRFDQPIENEAMRALIQRV